MNKIISTLIIFFVLPVMAEVSISKEYSFPPKFVKDLEKFLAEAAVRDSEMQNYPVAQTIDANNGIVIWCPAQMPTKDGKGCSLNFIIESDSFKFKIKKSLNLTFTGKQVEVHLNEHDPNSTMEHQHFGSLFELKDSFGSHYYCQPEGSEGTKIWRCYLYVNESFG